MKMTGRFPVFAKQAKLGKLTDLNGRVITRPIDFYMNNRLGFECGFTGSVEPSQLNGVLSFITEGLSNLYTRGVPEFTLNLAYPKGALVSFNGNVYISKCDENTTHISQTSHWEKLNAKQETKQTDELPIGTILTVPITTNKKGYIDYVSGKKFNPSIYPELYKALGTDTFAQLSNGTAYDSLPIGSCISVLSASANAPDGYIEWNSQVGTLRKYPELKEELTKVANRLTNPKHKQVWLDALRVDSLPMYSDFYFGSGEAGSMAEASVAQQEITSLPMVIDNSNTLNPMGVSRCVAQQDTYPVVAGASLSRQNTNTNYLVVGQRADQYKADVDKRLFSLVVGDNAVTRPKTLFTRVFVKAVNAQASAISSTHKQIIKAE